jgi:hypothetical protein
MRNIRNLSRIKTIIRHSGITVKNSPSIDHPIPVAVFYRNNPDGTVGRFWPKGNRQTTLPKFYKLFFDLGLENFLAHGKMVIYTDLPAATCLRHQWRRD